MAKQGKCTNFGNCGTADTLKVVTRQDSEEFVCPECGRRLTATGGATGDSAGTRRAVLFGGAGVVAFLGIGYCSTRFFHHASGRGGLLGGSAPILSFSGSNTIGEKLGPALAKAFFESKGYSNVAIGDTHDDETDVSGTKDGKTETIHFSAHGSGDAFKDLAKGSADIGMASRGIKADEVQSLGSLGDMHSPSCEHVIGLDGIAVIVNSANPLTQLGLSQVADLFSGRISDWAGVGGQPGPVKLYARKPPSGTLDFFKDAVLGGKDVDASAKSIEDSTELSNAVAADPQGVGFIGMPYVLNNRALAISADAKGGLRFVLPNLLTVKTEIYPISRRLFLYTPAHPAKPLVDEFIRFATGAAGQAIVADSKFVRFDVEASTGSADAVAAASNAPTEYRRLTANADLLQILYFNTGSPTPQPLAVAIMDSLPDRLDSLKLKPEQIMLFGFTDDVGNAASNVSLSWQRASSIAGALDVRGIKVGKVQGFGGTNFLRPNDSDSGRQQNRRVEIWAAKR